MPKQQSNNQQVAKRKQRTTARTNPRQPGPRQIGASVATRMPRIGFSDIMNHKISWILGYVFVGDGTNGVVDNVFFETASGTYLLGGTTTAFRGAAPIIGGDTNLGATYITDVEKHYARKRINRMLVTVASLQPSTANNMMCVVAPSRACGLAATSFAQPKATATTVQQAFTNVMSMDNALTVDAWETKTMDITKYIAGGSGAKQNEFEVAADVAATTVLSSGSIPTGDLEATVPACLIVSGNSTGSALRNTRTHAIIIEQYIDFLDFIGGSNSNYVVGVGKTTPSALPSDMSREEAKRVLGLD